MPAFSRLHRVSAIVPLAVLSAAWTVSLTGAGDRVAGAGATATLPDGGTVPSQAIEAPASVSSPISLPPAAASGDADTIVATASTSGIPSAALVAYQRAEAVINSADASCRIPWQLIAAIGRVESDHGRLDGSSLDDDGVAQPRIYGVALNGRNNTQKILDTDAGQLDSDTRFDRAVGPMQFIPSTWSVVGVDGDNDGKRNPQDVDDAALATAVYLCSGSDDLSSDQGQHASVYRYNHSNDYVDLVISIMQAYLAGNFTSMPDDTALIEAFLPNPAVPTEAPTRPGGKDRGTAIVRGTTSTPTPTTSATPTATPKPTAKPTPKPTPTATSKPTPTPTQAPTSSPTPTATPTSTATSSPTPTAAPTPTPTPTATPTPSHLPTIPVPLPTLPTLPTTGVPPLDQTLTVAQAQVQCLASGISVLNLNALTACVAALMAP